MLCAKTLDTPVGTMLAIAGDEGICAFEFHDPARTDAVLARIRKYKNETPVEEEHPSFRALEAQIGEYFRGTRKTFDLPLQLLGTGFQLRVWQALLQIPYGTTRSYKQQTLLLGDAKAIRAVAGANGSNGIAIIIPCHRIIGGNGSLTGYGGGLPRKQWLLDHERKHAGVIQQSSLFAAPSS